MPVKIHNKEYITVNERIKDFRKYEDFDDWSIITDIISINENSCVMKATILDKDGQVMATGHAMEDRESSVINQTSFVENCETSAVGRALGFLGIGIDTSVASADEMEMALAKQEKLQSKMVVIGGDYVFRGGKYEGKAIKEVPHDYLNWYAQNGADEFIKANIKKYAEEIKNTTPTEVDI